jgi:hypothetical protein
MLAPAMPLDKPLHEIGGQDLAELVENAVGERKVIDYKAELPGGGDEAKREFLADVSSFANAAGGHIVFGMTENGGLPTAVPGVEAADAEAETLRLESIIRDGIAPRLPGVGVQSVRLEEGRYAFVLRIAQSWLRPHMVTFRNLSRFFARNSAGKYQLDVGEIRSGFLAAPLASERVRLFRADRLARIRAGDLPFPLSKSPRVVLHLVPLAAFDDARPPFDLGRVRDDPRLRGLYTDQPFAGLGATRWNIDGLYTDDRWNDPEAESSLQVFRSGIIEAVDGRFLRFRANESLILGYPFERTLVDDVRRLLDLQSELGVEPPVISLVTLLSVDEWAILGPGQFEDVEWHRRGVRIDRDVVLLPEAAFDSLDDQTAAVLRPTFDAFWQAAGRPASPNYDADGNWLRRDE